jgi:energy-coupling factor transport system permease protein
MSVHPGAWVVWAFCAGLVAMLTTNPFYLLPLVGVSWLVYSARRIPGPSARSFRMFLTFALVALVLRSGLVLFGTLDAGNLAAAALEGLRLGTLLVVFGTFNSVADPYGVLRLAPRRFYEVGLASALALAFAPRMIAAVTRVRDAQRLRGIHISRMRMLPALAVPVLENGMEDALVLAESMDARGHGRGRRSRYRPLPWTVASSIVATAAMTALAIFLIAAINDVGGLVPSMLPPAWPGAESILVASVCLLAVPALSPKGDSP